MRVLFQADLRGVEPTVTLARLDADPDARSLLDDRDRLTDETPIVPPPEPDDSGPAGTSSGWTDAPRSASSPELDGFTRTLVCGVEEHRQEVETLITRYSRRWAIARMPVVDRNVLRLATYELLHEPTPPAVVIDEAVDLAKRLSTDDSGRFVNGVLESIRKDIADAQRTSAELGD